MRVSRLRAFLVASITICLMLATVILLFGPSFLQVTWQIMWRFGPILILAALSGLAIILILEAVRRFIYVKAPQSSATLPAPEMPLPAAELSSEADKHIRQRGLSWKTEFRFQVFKKIKTANPKFTRKQVAVAAAEELGELCSENDVENAYRAFREQWPRGQRS